jgi:hypothetical protein
MTIATRLNNTQRERIARNIVGYDGPMSGFNQFLESDQSKKAIYNNAITQIDQKMAVKMQSGGDVPATATAEQIQAIGKEKLGRDFKQKGVDFYKDYTPDQVKAMVGSSEEAIAYDKKQRGIPTTPEPQTVETSKVEYDPSQDIKFDPVKDTVTATGKKAKPAEVATSVDPREAAKIDPTKVETKVSEEAEKLKAVQGEISNEAIAQAQTVNATETAIKDAQASKIAQAVQIDNVPKRQVQAEEMIDGPSVKMARVEEQIDKVKAAQAGVDPKATVQGQLNELYQNFEAGNPPAWAAASMRNVTAILNQRGIGASSMAGQAIIQAQMEVALPIAQQDAQTIANLNIQNLSNRQQVAIISAEQRAKFLGLEFDQAFQTKVANASRIADIANQNFSAEVQVTLENAKMAQTVDLANLNNDQAVTMAKVSQIANLETTNLNNRQQAAVENAKSFLQMDLTNFGFEQQTNMFKSEKVIQGMLSDQAAENTAKQINASSENQVNQFYDNLTTQIATFNVEQKNAQERFNTQQLNAVEEFNANQINSMNKFNAQNSLAVSQSNAEWRRQIATSDTAMQNQVNMFNATSALNVSVKEYENEWQNRRDQMAYAWQTADNEADRYAKLATQIVSGEQDLKASKYTQKKQNEANTARLAVDIFKMFYP